MNMVRMSVVMGALLFHAGVSSCSDQVELSPLELETISVELFESTRIIKVVLLLEEPKAYFSLERTELSVLDSDGRWLLNGVLQLSASDDEHLPADSFAVRIPPGDDRGELLLVSDSGEPRAADPELGTLLPECAVSHTSGTALVTWVMQFENLAELPRNLDIHARSIPRGGQETFWREVAKGLVLDAVNPPGVAAEKSAPPDLPEAPAEPSAARNDAPQVSESDAGPSLFEAEPVSIIPLYSRLFDQVLLKKQEGDLSASLRLVPSIYSEEIPVDSFYSTLEHQRDRLLDALISSGIYSVAGKNYSVDDLREIFIGYLTIPDELSARRERPAEIDFSRFLFLHVAFGQAPSPPQDPLLKNAAPAVDLAAALTSLDPWALSAGLFHARKSGMRLSPETIIQRSKLRPDLWDQDCSNQAGLYLASRSAGAIDPSLSEQFQFVTVSRDRDEHCLVEGLQVNRVTGEVTPMPELSRGLHLIPSDRGAGQGSRVELDAASFSDGLLELAPGQYTLEIKQDRIQGQSKAFDCRPNRLVRVVIPLVAGE
ncbi:MAG: hypothetical protein JSU96_08630 [Acidobacteriota bacterium]|nr:MAG: hypothetical protein JSU96_08630 [Acidobacteriota bacterium]